ncbi:MAG: DUF4124 domain-containing protein [Candidatus Binatia bacterium]
MQILIFLIVALFFAAASAFADLYQWTDTDGVIHVVDEAGEVPEAYRDQVKVYQSMKSHSPPPASLPLSPSRSYTLGSEGQFAQKIALDLGLIRRESEDPIGPLIGAGIRPAGGWHVDEALTIETVEEVLSAARYAANAHRLSLSADGATAIIQQSAEAILPAPPPEELAYEEPPPQQIIIQQSAPQIIEVERETVPVYVPVPVIRGHSHFHRPSRRSPRSGDGPFAPASPKGPHTDRWYDHAPSTRTPSGPFTSQPSPSHMPFGASHMPFGASHMPFGSSSRGTSPSGKR